LTGWSERRTTFGANSIVNSAEFEKMNSILNFVEFENRVISATYRNLMASRPLKVSSFMSANNLFYPGFRDLSAAIAN
jgi:hypothetical protein